MKLLRLTIITTIAMLLATSCIKRIPKTDSNAKMIESIDEPRPIKETPIKEVEVEKNVDETDIIKAQEVEPAPVPKVAPTARNTRPTTSSRRDDDRIDPNNSGFFDRYEQNWDGDPNRNMKTTTRVVQPENNDIEREKQQIARSIELLEKQNQQNKEEFQQRQREIELKNQREIERAKQEEQQQKQKKAAPKGKTLDTDPLLNDRYK